jgi:hypothetical protein
LLVQTVFMDKPSSCGVIVGASINYTKEEGFFLLFW